jgi:hypothetical protein
MSVSESRASSFKDGLGPSLNGDSVDMERRLVRSLLQSESRFGFNGAQETASMNGTGLESALAAKIEGLEVATQMCEELRTKLTAAENQLTAIQSRDAANEQSVITLQERLDKLLESQEKADEQIPEAEVYEPEALEVLFIPLSHIFEQVLCRVRLVQIYLFFDQHIQCFSLISVI